MRSELLYSWGSNKIEGCESLGVHRFNRLVMDTKEDIMSWQQCLQVIKINNSIKISKTITIVKSKNPIK